MKITSVTFDRGCLHLRLDGSKQGKMFTSLAQLRQAVDWAAEVAPEVRLLLALREHLRTDPRLENVALLKDVVV